MFPVAILVRLAELTVRAFTAGVAAAVVVSTVGGPVGHWIWDSVRLLVFVSSV